MSAAAAPPAPTRTDEIVVAITEAIIASQRDNDHPSLSYVETDTTL